MTSALPPFSVRRSERARRARLTVTPEGDVVVVLPNRAPEHAATLLVRRHAAWVGRQLTIVAATQQRLADRPELVGGRHLPINGIPHTVREGRAAAQGRVERTLAADDDGLIGELLVRVAADGRTAVELLDAWLRTEARRILAARVAAWSAEMGVTPGRLTVRAQRTRWGSASRDGSLSFNWRLLLAPPFVLDAVVVHELAHLRWRGHGPRFWALAHRHAPRTEEARAWLRAHHGELLAALD